MITRESLVATTTPGGWAPGIGDPTVLGWLTVVAYIVAGLICCKAALAVRSPRWPSLWRGEPLFWILCAGFLLSLGINKQLDLQTWFTVLGKRLSQDMGWYAQRRFVQAAFIILIAALGTGLAAVAVWWTRRLSRPYHVARAGGIFLGAFIITRAASFHHVDQMLGLRIAGLRVNVALELGGIITMALAASAVIRSQPTERSNLRRVGHAAA